MIKYFEAGKKGKSRTFLNLQKMFHKNGGNCIIFIKREKIGVRGVKDGQD